MDKKARRPWNKGKKIDRNKYPNFGHLKRHSRKTRERLRHIAITLGVKPPSRKGSVWSKEQHKKFSKVMRGRKILWGEKISRALKGRKLTKEHRRKLSELRKGKNIDDNSPSWKGESVTYHGLHKWVRRRLGRAEYCENRRKQFLRKKCSRKSNRFHWANKLHVGRGEKSYVRDLKKWVALCASCHNYYDKK